jgi:hypothetical protein
MKRIKFTESKTVFRMINGKMISDKEWKERLQQLKNKEPFVRLKKDKT